MSIETIKILALLGMCYLGSSIAGNLFGADGEFWGFMIGLLLFTFLRERKIGDVVLGVLVGSLLGSGFGLLGTLACGVAGGVLGYFYCKKVNK